MRWARLGKWFGTGVAVLIVLVIAAILAAAILIDPNDYKRPIQDAVLERTGRELHLEGDLALSVFPWVGVEMKNAWLNNPDDFGEGPFARIDRAAVRVKLLPLLQKRVEVATVVLDGLSLRLVRRADGRTNWEDLAAMKSAPRGKAPSERPEEPASGGPLPWVSVSGLRLSNARLEWKDEMAGSGLTLSDISLSTDAMEPAVPFPLDLSFRFDSEKPRLRGNFKLDLQARLDPAAQRWAVDRGRLSLSLDEADFVREAVSAVVDVQGRGSLRGDSLEISSLVLTLPGLRAEGRLEVKKDSGTLGFSGELAAKPMDPRRLLKLLRPELLEDLPQGAFNQASLAFRFSGTPHALKIPQLQAVLDRSQLNAQVDLSSLRPAKGTFQITVNELDLDRFLPAASAPAETKAASSSPLQAGKPSKKSSGRDPMLVIPPEIDVSGTVAVDLLKAAKLTLSQVKALMAVKDGRLVVQPFQAALYGGSLTGTLDLSADGQGPRGDISYDLTNVAIGALLRDLQGKESLTGTAAVKGRTAFAGANADAVKRSLSGTTHVRVTDGSYKGVNIPRMIREAKAAVQGRKLEPGEEEAATDFTELTATLVMKSGVVRNDDLSAKSPYLRLEGRGTVDLPAEAIDYLLTTTLVAVPRGQSGEDLEDLMGVPIPIRIHGPLGKPRYALDMKAVLEAVARGKVREKVEAVEEKLKEKLEKKVPGLKGLDLKKLF